MRRNSRVSRAADLFRRPSQTKTMNKYEIAAKVAQAKTSDELLELSDELRALALEYAEPDYEPESEIHTAKAFVHFSRKELKRFPEWAREWFTEHGNAAVIEKLSDGQSFAYSIRIRDGGKTLHAEAQTIGECKERILHTCWLGYNEA